MSRIFVWSIPCLGTNAEQPLNFTIQMYGHSSCPTDKEVEQAVFNVHKRLGIFVVPDWANMVPVATKKLHPFQYRRRTNREMVLAQVRGPIRPV